jgi:hypothetical protein
MIYRPRLTLQLAGPARWRWLDYSASEDLKPLPAPTHQLAKWPSGHDKSRLTDRRLGQGRVDYIFPTCYRQQFDDNAYLQPRVVPVFAKLLVQTEHSPQYPGSEQVHTRATSPVQHLTIPQEMIE